MQPKGPEAGVEKGRVVRGVLSTQGGEEGEQGVCLAPMSGIRVYLVYTCRNTHTHTHTQSYSGDEVVVLIIAECTLKVHDIQCIT